MDNKALLDNIIFDLQEIGGISNYWFNLLKIFKNINNIYYFENNHKNKNYYRSLIDLPNNQCIKDKSIFPIKIKRYLPINNIDKYYDFDVFHSSYYRYANWGIKNVTTVHDFMYEKFLSKFNCKRLIHSIQKSLALKNSDYIIGVSKNTLDDMIEYFPELKGKKKQVIWHGISDDFYLLHKEKNFITIQNQKLYDNSYYFYFGNRSGYKNFNLLLEAYYGLLKRSNNLPKLVVASGGDFTKIEKKLIDEMNIDQVVIKLDKLSQEELNYLYNYCTGFIYPSLYEGFGMPILEAMKAGAPVACSNTSSLPEVAGEAAIYFNPTNVIDLERATYYRYYRSGWFLSGRVLTF